MDGSEEDKKKLDKILSGETFYVMGRKYRVVNL
jgi:hypothetical protein